MQSADFPEFEELVGQLCAGYEVPATKARKDAHWAGCRALALAQYRRCVEFALSEEGPEDLPTPKGIWRIHRGFRAAGLPRAQGAAAADTRDHLAYWANRLLLVHISSRGCGSVNGTASAELQACLKLQRELITWFAAPIREGDPDCTPAEFLRQWMAGLQEISSIEPGTYARWCALLEQAGMQEPFPPSMARELHIEPPHRELVPA